MSTNDMNCWVCYASEQEDRNAVWLKPCRCRGATKWVHQHCLERWVDEKQHGDTTLKVSCMACNTEYVIIYPEPSSFLYLMELTDNVIYKACPYLCGLVLLGSVYWTAVTYGTLTVIQVMGQNESFSLMEHADPMFLLVGLPVVPVALILGKMVRWEDYIFRFGLKHCTKLPFLQTFLPKDISRSRYQYNLEYLTMSPNTMPRVLCGALIFPTIATIIGKLCFTRISSNLQRTLLGAMAFIGVKGALKIRYFMLKYLRSCRRVIQDYPSTSPQDDLHIYESVSGSPSNH